MGNCWSCMEKAMCGRREEETNALSSAPERSMEPLTVEAVEADKQNPMESPVASTSIPQTSTALVGPSESKKPPLTLEKVIHGFAALKEAGNVDDLIYLIRQVLDKKSKQQDKSDKDEAITSSTSTSSRFDWREWINSGTKFLEFFSGHCEKMEKERGFNRSVVTAILDKVGHLHWAVAGLSIVAWLLENYEKMCANKAECQQLLKRMIDLAINVKEVYGLILKEEDENWKKVIEDKLRLAIVLIADGSVKCCFQMGSTRKFFRFLNSPADNAILNSLKEEINDSYRDLTLTVTIINSRITKTIERQQSVILPMEKPSSPKNAVGLDEPVKQIIEMVELGKAKEPAKAVVIYGFGGIGKTTLANAVLANLNLEGYSYTKINIHEDPQKNDLKSMQQQLLKDVFPEYQDGRKITLRDCEEGRHHLTRALQGQSDKPVFICIDNALRGEDLVELLPEDLGGLSQRSRILVTARDLRVTELFEERGLLRRYYRVKTLSDEHGEKILCNDPDKLEEIKDDVKKVLQICGGIPLALKIVGAQLRKQKYRADNCSEILRSLEKGEEIKQEQLSERLVNFVYNRFETSTKEAFLDICTVLDMKVITRRWTEYIVGVTEVSTLEEAALITAVPLANSFDDIRERGVYWEGEEELIVHDVILAKGRSMAKDTRIVDDAQSFCRAVEDQKVLHSIKGVNFRYEEESEFMFEESQLSCMSNSLRVFRLGHRMSVGGLSSNTFQELRYLQIIGDIPCLPVKLEALPRLAFYVGPIFKEGFTLNKLPKSLRYLRAEEQSNRDECATSEESNPIQTVQNSSLQELDLACLENMRILLDGIHQFIGLKILSVDGWDEMEELPAQVCQLRSLNKLNMSMWKSLKRLPQSFSNLTGLTHLDLNLCVRLEGLCSSFGELRGLRYLSLWKCEMLTELPYSFGQLIVLEYLDLDRCISLAILPDNFGELSALKYLNLSYCNELKGLPSNFVRLTNLQVLELYGRKELGLGLEELSSLKILG